MNLLLLLSAFLTALTGAITGARPMQAAAQEQVVGRGAAQAASVAAVTTSRPTQGWPLLARMPEAAERAFLLAAATPLFGQRRRE